MAKAKKRVKSHRSPDWKPKVKPQQTRAEERVEKMKTFPIWGVAVMAANAGMILTGGVISVLLAAVACMLEWTVLKQEEIPAANKLLYCLLILIGSWVLWFVLMLVYQSLFY